MDHTIGTRLRHAREERGLSIAHVADAIRLRPSVVQWLESDDFTPCGPAAYVRGYLRSLATYLDLPADDVVAEYTRLYQPTPPSAVPRIVDKPRRYARNSHASGSVAARGASADDASDGAQPEPRNSRRPHKTSRSQRAEHAQSITAPGMSHGAGGASETPRTSARRWLPMMWFAVVIIVVAALGYTLVNADAHRRSSVPSTSGAHGQPFSPSPAPFNVDRIEPARMPAALRV